MTALRKTRRTEKRFSAGLPWTETEVARLRRLYPKTSNKDLASMFGRGVLGITGKARALKLKKDYTNGYRTRRSFDTTAWSAEEEELLTRLFVFVPNEEIAEQLGRTRDAVANKARKLGLQKMEFWSDEEDELLRKLYKKLSYELMSSLLGRTKSSIQIRVITLGLESKVENCTEDEITFLKDSYPGTDYCVIAGRLGRTPAAVAAKADRMKIKRLRLNKNTGSVNKIEYPCVGFSRDNGNEGLKRHIAAVG